MRGSRGIHRGCGVGQIHAGGRLHARGHLLLADDIVAVHDAEGEHLVYPGLPEFRLWPDTLRSLGEDALPLPVVFSGAEKRIYAVREGMQGQPMPLKRVYLLSRGKEHAISRLPLVTAILAMVRHTYGMQIMHSIMPAQHLLQCGALAQTVPVCLLARRRMTLDELPELLDMVEGDMQHGE